MALYKREGGRDSVGNGLLEESGGKKKTMEPSLSSFSPLFLSLSFFLYLSLFSLWPPVRRVTPHCVFLQERKGRVQQTHISKE
jgi:hypothetical protein